MLEQQTAAPSIPGTACKMPGEIPADVKAVIEMINFAIQHCGLIYLQQLREQFDEVAGAMRTRKKVPCDRAMFDIHTPVKQFPDTWGLVNVGRQLGSPVRLDEC